MLHRVILGSVERFIGNLIEHYGGAFPLWLAPKQIAILPVNPDFHNDYAQKLSKQLFDLGYRVVVDERNEKLGYRMREAQIKKIPIQLVVGDREIENEEVNMRRYGEKAAKNIKVVDFMQLIKDEVENKQ